MPLSTPPISKWAVTTQVQGVNELGSCSQPRVGLRAREKKRNRINGGALDRTTGQSFPPSSKILLPPQAELDGWEQATLGFSVSWAVRRIESYLESPLGKRRACWPIRHTNDLQKIISSLRTD